MTAPLVALALAAACSGGSTPQTLPSLTPTPSASATPVAIPPAATVESPQGAEAFVRFFFGQLNAAFSDSDASRIEPLIDANCGTCSNYVKALKADPSSVIRGQSFAVESVAASPLASGGSYVSVFGRVPPRELVARDGRLLKSLPDEGAFNFTVAALRTNKGWLVRAIRINK
ncbi:MAG: hypothetical protein JWL79_2659 [Frankiales bacterium]|nr:hypothetical protein [Frankiales bacterium]